jgi:hypothetical protein
MNMASIRQRSPKAAASAVPRSLARRSPSLAISPQSYPAPTIARCACGGGCPRCRASPSQPKAMRISPLGDPFEREADEVADRVLAGIEVGPPSVVSPLVVQRSCWCGGSQEPDSEECEECGALRLQRQPDGSARRRVAPQLVDSVLSSPGEGLAAPVRAEMEAGFGRDLFGVRIHTDGRAAQSARAVSATAYTVGHHIVFGAGRYAPDVVAGRRLLAHELAHVFQQDGADRDSGAVLRRQLAEEGEDEESLKSGKFAGNDRLERAFRNSPAIHIGESGDGVRLVQEALVDQGFQMPGSTKPTGELDGQFGQETFDTIKQFQAQQGLEVDGIVGHETLRELDQLEAEKPDQPLLKPRPGEQPSVIKLPGGLQILLPGGALPGEIPEIPGGGGIPNVFGSPQEKTPVQIVPKDRRKPLDLRNFQCETKRVLKVEIFTGMVSDLITTQILTARLLLSQHNMDLEATIKPISSPAFPLGFDVNIPSLGDGEVQHHIDLCELIGKTIKDVGHQSGFMPVFFIPVGIFVMGSGDDGAVAFFARDADSLVCQLGGGSTGLKSLIVMNVRADLCDTTLLHEIGHAAGNPHAGGTVMDGAGCAGKNLNVILHDQVRRFCNASFP